MLFSGKFGLFFVAHKSPGTFYQVFPAFFLAFFPGFAVPASSKVHPNLLRTFLMGLNTLPFEAPAKCNPTARPELPSTTNEPESPSAEYGGLQRIWFLNPT